MTVKRITLVWRAMTLALVLAMILSACAPQTVVETVVVTQEVEKVVEKTVEVEVEKIVQVTAEPISEYTEAPQLAALVGEGKLPPVDERLPENPMVVLPVDSVGKYGGTWHRGWGGIKDFHCFGP